MNQVVSASGFRELCSKHRVSHVPDSARLKVGRSAGKNRSGQYRTRLTAVHHTLGDWREKARMRRWKLG